MGYKKYMILFSKLWISQLSKMGKYFVDTLPIKQNSENERK